MIWTPILLEPTDEQLASLKTLNARLMKYLEEGASLRTTTLDTLRDAMSEVVNQTASFRAVLDDLSDSGDHIAVQLEHPDNEILNLPWAMAVDSRSQRSLGNIGQLYLTKRIPKFYSDDASSPHRVAPAPLKVLIMISSPLDTPPSRQRLSYEEEEFQILKAFEPLMRSGDVEIDFTDDGSLDALERKLKKNQYHVVHFSGHSSYRDGTSYMQLENALTLRTEQVTAAEFANSINCVADYRPALVVLSTCQSAQGDTEEGIRGTTNKLLSIGVPAVISMGLSISDKYATEFAASLYGEIAEKKDIIPAFRTALDVIRQLEYDDLVKANAAHTEPFQWIIPNLYLRTRLASLVDWRASEKGLNLSSYQYIVEKNRLVLQHDEGKFVFVGRRRDKAQILPVLSGGLPVLLKGQGGVGKTTMAEYLVQRLIAANPNTAPFVFTEALSSIQDLLDTMKSFLSKHHLFDALLRVDEFTKAGDQFNYLCSGIERGGYRPLFVFDNLESFQSAPGAPFSEEHADILTIMEQIYQRQRYPLLLTSRYPLAEFPDIHVFDLNQVPLTDFWKRCHYLNLYRLQEFFQSEDQKQGKSKWLQKRDVSFLEIVTWLHNTFGGNYRALEWFDRLFNESLDDIDEILVKMDQLQAVLSKKTEAVIGQMRDDLKLDMLLGLLGQDELDCLMLLTRFNIPVQQLALTLQTPNTPKGSKQAPALERLHSLTLLEHSYDPETLHQYYYATPIIKDLFINNDALLKNITFDHHQAGIYHYHIFTNVDTSLSELGAAFTHFKQAESTEKVSQVGDHLSAIYYRISLTSTALFYARQVYEMCGKDSSPTILNRLGLIYYRMGENSKALDFYEGARKIYQETGNKSGEGAILNNISRIYDARGDYDRALTYLEASLKIRQETQDKFGEGATLNNMATAAHARGDYDTALEYLEASLKIRQEIGDKSGEGATLNNISQIYDARGDYDTALEYLEASLKIFQETQDKSAEGTTLNNISQIFRARGDYDTALTYMEASLKISQEIGDKSGEGTTLNNMATAAHARGDYDTALVYLEASLKIRREIQEKPGEGVALNNISQIFRARGDYDTALEYLETSLKISREIGDKAGEGTTLNNMAATAHARGDYDTALAYMEDSLKIQQEIGDKAGEGTTLNNISQIFSARGDDETALTYLKASLKIRQEIGDKSGSISTLHNMAMIYHSQGNQQKFIEHEASAYQLANETGDALGLFHVGQVFGQILIAGGQREEGAAVLKRSYEIGKQGQLPGTDTIEKLLQELGAL